MRDLPCYLSILITLCLQELKNAKERQALLQGIAEEAESKKKDAETAQQKLLDEVNTLRGHAQDLESRLAALGADAEPKQIETELR